MIEPAEKTGMRNAWGRVASAYDERWSERTLGFTEAGLDLLAPASDAIGLDVGCGPGHTAVALSRRLNAGRTTGVDFAPAMVERARERWAHVDRLEFDVDDAEHLSQPAAAFDVVTSSFALMYCYDALGALGQMARVLRPGGRMLTLVWGSHQAVWWSPVIEVVESRAAYYSSVCPMMFFYGLPGVLARMLEQTGLTVESSVILDTPMRYANIDDAVRAAILAGPLSGLFQNRLDEAAQMAAWQAMTDVVTARAEPDGDGIALASQVMAIVARRQLGAQSI